MINKTDFLFKKNQSSYLNLEIHILTKTLITYALLYYTSFLFPDL